MNKFGRNYRLSVQLVDGDILTIAPPFTADFDIQRTQNSSANTAVFRIYNLSKIHRNQIRYNQYDPGTQRSIKFEAGYGDTLSTAHDGFIQLALSYREGTNFITEITGFDGGHAYQTADFSETIAASTTNPITKKELIRRLIAKLPNVSAGAIGNYIGMYYRPYSFNGSTIDALREETGKGFFIDNGKAHVLQNNEYLVSNNVPLINSSTGLIGTPMLQLNTLSFEMLFEPSLYVGQLIQLQSSTFQDSEGTNLNGFYKINLLSHRGTISDAVCGEAITCVGMYYDLGEMRGVVAL